MTAPVQTITTGHQPTPSPGKPAMTSRHQHHHREPHHASPSGTADPDVPDPGQPGPGPAAERLAYSVAEAARLTGLSRDLLYDEMRRGNLPYLKVGRRRVITRQHLQQFLGMAS